MGDNRAKNIPPESTTRISKLLVFFVVVFYAKKSVFSICQKMKAREYVYMLQILLLTIVVPLIPHLQRDALLRIMSLVTCECRDSVVLNCKVLHRSVDRPVSVSADISLCGTFYVPLVLIYSGTYG